MENLLKNSNLTGKTVIVTGSNTGIGKETALALARLDARVILACRSLDKANAAREDIVADSKNEKVVVMKLDLSSFASIREFADKFNSNEDRLDILVNNAAVSVRERSETADGFELMFGTNHLGPFLLTNLLLEKLKASAPSRVVSVASEGHEIYPLNFDDLQSKKSFNGMRVYCESKSANILFTVELAKVLNGTGVTCYSVHPGFIITDLARDYDMNKCKWCCVAFVYRCIKCKGTLEPHEGAYTSLYCCLEPSIANVSGRYYSECREKRAKPHATNPESAKKLWDISVEMTRLGQ